MKISVKVIPHAKQNSLQEKDGVYRIYLTAPAVEGKANAALVEFLAEYFNVKKSRVAIIKGLKSRNKIVMIGD